MRLLTLSSGLAALVVAPAMANAQASNAYGGDRYGGAKVGEETKKPAEQAAPPQANPNEAQPTGGQTEPQQTEQQQQQQPDQGKVEIKNEVTVPPAPPPAQPQQPQQPSEPVAQPVPPPENVNVNITENKPHPTLPMGLAISAGGGIEDFSGDGMRGLTDIGGTWEARLTFGTRSILGLEAAYVGTANGITSLGLDSSAILMSNGAEAVARLNIGTFRFQPFVFGGVGWGHYQVTNTSVNTSDLADNKDVLLIPFGGGISTYLGDHFMADARFTYRSAFYDDIFRTADVNSGGAGLANWAATLRLGYQF